MKKNDNFEKNLGAFIVEYTQMQVHETSYVRMYNNPDMYPFFRRMCDVIVRDILNGHDEHGYIYANMTQVICEVLGDDVCELEDGTYIGIEDIDTGIYEALITYAERAQEYVHDSFLRYDFKN